LSTTFAVGEERWRARLGTLRQVVRQELVTRQLARHVPGRPGRRVLDIGCGQGTQLLSLARHGHTVTGLDSSQALLGDLARSLRAEAPEVRGRVRLVRGDARDTAALFRAARFDVVLCHGVLMYFPDPGPMLAAAAAVTAPGGLVSLLVRNGDALAMRPGLRGDWAAHGLEVQAWYGVRVFTDLAGDDAPVPDAGELRLLLACEERAGSTDPYRAVAALLHVLARRS